MFLFLFINNFCCFHLLLLHSMRFSASFSFYLPSSFILLFHSFFLFHFFLIENNIFFSFLLSISLSFSLSLSNSLSLLIMMRNFLAFSCIYIISLSFGLNIIIIKQKIWTNTHDSKQQQQRVTAVIEMHPKWNRYWQTHSCRSMSLPSGVTIHRHVLRTLPTVAATNSSLILETNKFVIDMNCGKFPISFCFPIYLVWPSWVQHKQFHAVKDIAAIP